MALGPKVRMLATTPPELVVYDEPSECSYLQGETWRLPLRLPVRQLTHNEFGRRLDDGDRRQGRLLYRTACPSCVACEPIRLETDRFELSRGQRRVFKRANEQIEVDYGEVEIDEARVHMYNLHKHGRGLARGELAASLETYRAFLGDSCVETFEMRYFVDDELLGIAIVDRAHNALSAVYFYGVPKFSSLSPGVYSILKQLELCRTLGLDYLYLGLYIAQCPAMSYKGRYLPHERLIAGTWRRFDRAASDDAELYVP